MISAKTLFIGTVVLLASVAAGLASARQGASELASTACVVGR
jgi:hypothetical protein